MPIESFKDYFSEHPHSIGTSAASILASSSSDKTRQLYDQFVKLAEEGKPPVAKRSKSQTLSDNIHRRILTTELGKYIYPHTPDDVFFNEEYPWAHIVPQGWMFPDQNKSNVPVLLKDGGKGLDPAWIIELYHAMAVADSPSAVISVLNFKTLAHVYFKLPRDKHLIQSVMALEAEFHSTVERRARAELEDF